MLDTAVTIKRLELKEKKRERNFEILKSVVDTTTKAATSPIGIMILASVANQVMYNAGLFNPHDPNHTIEEDWYAGQAVSDWLFFGTLTVAACMAAKESADILPSISDFI